MKTQDTRTTKLLAMLARGNGSGRDQQVISSSTGLRAVPLARQAQAGFTVVELLVAMALIVLLMFTLSQAFSGDARTFDKLKEIGDLDEQLRSDALALADAITLTGQRAQAFIENGLQTGTVNRAEATALREQYEAICATAVNLEARLRDVQAQIHNPGAQRVLQNSLDALTRLKFSAATMVALLRLVE